MMLMIYVVKGKVVSLPVLKEYRGSRGLAVLLLNLCSRWKCVLCHILASYNNLSTH